jgi:hypothetical protein
MKTIPRQFRLTVEQNKVFEALLGEQSINEYLRGLIANDAKARGLSFPDDMPDRAETLAKARENRWK